MAFREGFHLVFGALYFLGIYYTLYCLRLPDVDALRIRMVPAGGAWKYLTHWNLVLQAVFFLLSFINDVFGTVKTEPTKRGMLQAFLDNVFAGLAFPGATFVSTSFWTLYLYNRDIVFPPIFDTFFPQWLNHIVHTLIFPGVVIEMIAVPHRYPSRKKGLSIQAFATSAYIIWIFIAAHFWKLWIYPILEVLNWWQRIVFIVACGAASYVFYLIGEGLNSLLWGRRIPAKQVSSKKKTKAS